MTEPVIVSETSESRGSGFPQMTIHNENVYFAWTDYKEESGSKVLLSKLGL